MNTKEIIVSQEKQRKLVIRRDKYKCRQCGSSRELQAHHESYEQMVGTEYELDNLITLCRKCHEEFHDNKHYDRGLGRHIDKDQEKSPVEDEKIFDNSVDYREYEIDNITQEENNRFLNDLLNNNL